MAIFHLGDNPFVAEVKVNMAKKNKKKKKRIIDRQRCKWREERDWEREREGGELENKFEENTT